jgi:hypothetical protein
MTFGFQVIITVAVLRTRGLIQIEGHGMGRMAGRIILYGYEAKDKCIRVCAPYSI